MVIQPLDTAATGAAPPDSGAPHASASATRARHLPAEVPPGAAAIDRSAAQSKEQRSPWPGHGRGPGAPTAPWPGSTAGDVPRLADGIELVGQYEGSGYREPHYLARRRNGSLIQLTQLLHLVAEACDGQCTLDQIAARVSDGFGRTVSHDNVRQLLDEKLLPLGVVAPADGVSPDIPPADPLLALRLKTTLLNGRGVRLIATAFRPLFWPPIIVAVLLALVGFDIWLFFVHGVAQSLRRTVEQPLIFLLVAGVVVVSAALHEMGHAAAAVYGGAKPGRMGAGVFVVWPAFYTDVTDAYRLDRRGRLRTDLGGVYFNALVVLTCALVFVATAYEPLLLVCFVVQVQILQQLLPLLRLDGYYVLADAVGVPDLFKRVGPILVSVLPWRETDPLVQELKRRVRVVVTCWTFAIVPLLLVNLLFVILQLPRIAATAWDSAARHIGVMQTSSGATAAVAVVQLAFLVLPTIGIVISMARAGRVLWGRARKWARGSLSRAALVLALAGAATGLLGLAWWPDQRLAPYRAGERGTLIQGVSDLRYAGSGTALLRSPREAQQPLPAVEDGTSAVAGTRSDAPAEVTPDPDVTDRSTSGQPTRSAEPTARVSTDPRGPAPSPSPSATPSRTPRPSPTSSPRPSQAVAPDDEPIPTPTPEEDP